MRSPGSENSGRYQKGKGHNREGSRRTGKALTVWDIQPRLSSQIAERHDPLMKKKGSSPPFRSEGNQVVQELFVRISGKKQ